MNFEWDEDKAARNVVKQGIGFAAATRIFLDLYRLELEGEREEYGETRIKVVGAIDNEVFVVVYTIRSNNIRLISARRASRRERRVYHTHKASS